MSVHSIRPVFVYLSPVLTNRKYRKCLNLIEEGGRPCNIYCKRTLLVNSRYGSWQCYVVKLLSLVFLDYADHAGNIT